MAHKPETLFRKEVVTALKSLERIKIFSIQQSTIVGTPDLLICLNGRFVALELKSNQGKASALQEYQIEQVNKSGGYGIIVTPSNWKFVLERLKAMS